jgi:hypothetical protein
MKDSSLPKFARRLQPFVAALALAGFSAAAQAQIIQTDSAEGVCGTLQNPYGPYDYSNPTDVADRLPIVEINHFTPDVENHIKGITGPVPIELDYTLRAFPNHTRALWSMARYQLEHPWRPSDRYRSIECYFARALAFKSDDATVWMVKGMYSARKGDHMGAIKEYDRAEKLQPGLVEVSYNQGLSYFAIKEYAKARELAEKAYAQGYPLPGLKNKLIGVGQWRQGSSPSNSKSAPARSTEATKAATKTTE